jgi:hypothetical protein
MEYLQPNEDFLRGVDIDAEYLKDPEEDKKMYAYTNKAVEQHNAAIQGYTFPKEGDTVFIPTLRKNKVFKAVSETHEGDVLTANGIINNDTKYNPLTLLNRLKYVKFFHFDDGSVICGIFGSYQNKVIRDKIGKALVKLNKEGKNSKKAFREYKTLNDFVCIIDFDHCMTVHKSQGSECKHSYVDSKDIAICKDLDERMKLTYVGMSRAKSKVFFSN